MNSGAAMDAGYREHPAGSGSPRRSTQNPHRNQTPRPYRGTPETPKPTERSELSPNWSELGVSLDCARRKGYFAGTPCAAITARQAQPRGCAPNDQPPQSEFSTVSPVPDTVTTKKRCCKSGPRCKK